MRGVGLATKKSADAASPKHVIPARPRAQAFEHSDRVHVPNASMHSNRDPPPYGVHEVRDRSRFRAVTS